MSSLAAPPWVIALVLLLAAAVGLLVLLRRRQRRQTDRLRARLVEVETALRTTQIERAAAERAAEAADRAQARFLAAASHDLRQPAHALGLYMATLRGGALAPEQAEIAARMAASLAALESMLSRLLDLSRLDAGELEPNWDVVPLVPLLRRLADEFGAGAEARGLRLALHLPPAAAEPVLTVTDPVLLERVLRNLLANAVKHTERGGVLLACRARRLPAPVEGDAAGNVALDAPGGRSAGAGLQWRIEVWDSGPGIAPADAERVFEPFFQAGNPGRRRAEGQGLGLAIVRGLAQLLGLRVVLHSRAGRGSVFFVEGLVPGGSMPQAATAARAALRRLVGSRVALLEDDDEVRDATARLLASWGVQVVAAGDADALEAALAGTPPQALVADVRLGAGRRGPDEAARLMAGWGRPVPLLLVSGESAPEVLAALRAHGHTCLTKPVAPPRLRAWLEQVLRADADAAAAATDRSAPEPTA